MPAVPLVLWGVALLVGCGKADPDPATYPVTGTVVYQEQPVVGANITFHTTSTGTDAMAVTDEQGAFDVSTYFDLGRREKRGMTVGEYRVTILKLDTGAIKTTFSPPQNLLPKKYESVKSSGLDAQITDHGTNHFDFKLTD